MNITKPLGALMKNVETAGEANHLASSQGLDQQNNQEAYQKAFGA